MDLTKRVERLETLLAEQQDRSLAAEIVAHLFYARLLNVSEAMGDPMDLNKSIERLDEDITAAIAEAATPERAGQWHRVGARAIGLVKEIREMRLAYRPANNAI